MPAHYGLLKKLQHKTNLTRKRLKSFDMNKKELATEYPHPDEERFTDDIIRVMSRSLKRDFGAGRHHRRFHAKSAGLLEAELRVEATLPEHLQQGLFKTPKTYKAWVRFSNSATKPGPDYKKGIRGMSIKILDVGAAPLERDAFGQTQDILLTNNPIVFPGTAALQRLAMRALFAHWIYYPYVLLLSGLRGFLTLLKSQVRLANFLESPYYSATPCLFGNGQAVKWKAEQAQRTQLFQNPMPVAPGANFLRERLAETVSKESVAFHLYVQFQHDPKKEPIEDSAVCWKTSFEKVATLTLLQQDFNTRERNDLDDTIVFSPWHCLPEHRPLGGINRLRRRIYRALALRRQQHNADVKPEKEPA